MGNHSLDVPMEIGKSQFLHSVYVANDINSDSILGLDVLNHLEIEIDGCLIKNQEQLPLECQQTRLTVSRITLQEDVIAPSLHKVIFLVSLELSRNPGTYDSVVEPDAIRVVY